MNILLLHRANARIAPMVSSTISDYGTRLYERSVAQINNNGVSLYGHRFQVVLFHDCDFEDFSPQGQETLGWILASPGIQVKRITS